MTKLTLVLVVLTGLGLATVVYYLFSRVFHPIPEAVAAPLPPSIQKAVALAPFLPPAWNIADSREEKLGKEKRKNKGVRTLFN